MSFRWPFDFALHIHKDCNYNVSFPNLIENSKKNLFGTRLSGGKTSNQWNKIFNNEFNCPENLYQNIAESVNAKLISFRWNQQSFYASNWLSRSQNHYWLSIIRNPYDRIYSNIKTHGWDFTRASKFCVTGRCLLAPGSLDTCPWEFSFFLSRVPKLQNPSCQLPANGLSQPPT